MKKGENEFLITMHREFKGIHSYNNAICVAMEPSLENPWQYLQHYTPPFTVTTSITNLTCGGK